jgi:uncharacterized protein YcfJ
MSMSLKAALGVVGLVAATTASAQVTLYSRDGFRGEQFTANGTVRNLERLGFNDRANSVVVNGGNWQACEDANFAGRCVILQPGEYPTLDRIGLENEISSIRPVEGRYGYNRDDRAYVAQGYGDRRGDDQGYVDRRNDDQGYGDRRGDGQGYGDRRADERRGGDQLFEAPVTSVRAVLGPPEQRCWVERGEYRGETNVPGAVAGAVIGGLIGNQIGHGTGRAAATAGGAIAGGAIGSNVGTDSRGADIQHCSTAGNYDHPDYWDVTYSFRGEQHRVQMSSPPGSTVTVNEYGDPQM